MKEDNRSIQDKLVDWKNRKSTSVLHVEGNHKTDRKAEVLEFGHKHFEL